MRASSFGGPTGTTPSSSPSAGGRDDWPTTGKATTGPERDFTFVFSFTTLLSPKEHHKNKQTKETIHDKIIRREFHK